MGSLQGYKFSAHFNIQAKITGGSGGHIGVWGKAPQAKTTFTHLIPLDRISKKQKC